MMAGALFAAPADAGQEKVYPEKSILVQDFGNGSRKLLTPRAVYTGPDGRMVELIGAVHVGEKQYYKDLEAIFGQCDKLLFEMVGGEDIPRIGELQRKLKSGGMLTAEEEKEMEQMLVKAQKVRDDENVLMKLLGPMYATMASALGMVSQKDGIDYYAHSTFVHADMTAAEFDQELEKRGQSIWSEVTSMSDRQKVRDSMDIDLLGMAGALLSGNYRYLKGEVIKLMASAEVGGKAEKWSVILDGRNEKCFEVFDSVNKDKENKHIGIFYGSAHLPGMHRMLLDRGFKLDKVEWLVAWDTETVPK